MNSTPKDPEAHARFDREVVEATASRWVTRRNEKLTMLEQRDLAAWLALDVRHVEAFERLSALASALRRARETGAAASLAAELAVRARRRRNRRHALAGAGLAAALVVGFGFYFKSTASLPSAPVREHGQLIASRQYLPDGSTIEFDAGSEVAIHYEAAFRRVTLLRGHAFFQVAKDASRPFIVSAGGVGVRAVGTAFDVGLGATKVEVLVTEGKVGVEDTARGRSLLPVAADGHPIPLVAGQHAVIESDRMAITSIVTANRAQLQSHVAQHIDRLVYDGIELATAVARLNEHNPVKITLAQPAIGQLLVSGSFPPDQPETFARMIANTFGLEAARDGTDAIVLRRP